jgi:hypothetical protein
MQLVSTVTVGAGGAASIDFSSIPQTGTDLLIVLSGRSTTAATQRKMEMLINGTAANTSSRNLAGNGSATSSSVISPYQSYWTMPGASAAANTFSNDSIYFPNYAGATNKSFSVDTVGEDNATLSYQNIIAGLNSSTGAITSISLKPDSGNFAQYSTASLYIITKGSGGATVS